MKSIKRPLWTFLIVTGIGLGLFRLARETEQGLPHQYTESNIRRSARRETTRALFRGMFEKTADRLGTTGALIVLIGGGLGSGAWLALTIRDNRRIGANIAKAPHEGGRG